jgi:hypothetical protein
MSMMTTAVGVIHTIEHYGEAGRGLNNFLICCVYKLLPMSPVQLRKVTIWPWRTYSTRLRKAQGPQGVPQLEASTL